MALEYKQKVAELIGDGQPITKEAVEAKGWRGLDGLLHDDVLSAAARGGRVWYEQVLGPLHLDPPPTARPEKSMARVLEKIQESKDNIERGWEGTEFKPHSDLCAFNIAVKDPKEIMRTVDSVARAIEDAGGSCYVRPNRDCSTGCIGTDGEVKDIVVFAFLYHKEAGFVAELQIGHPFAAYTFHLDSTRRSVKKAEGDVKAAEMLDLWEHKFYNSVKEQLLADLHNVTRLEKLYGSLVEALRQGGPASPQDPGLPHVRTVLGLPRVRTALDRGQPDSPP